MLAKKRFFTKYKNYSRISSITLRMFSTIR